MKSVNPDVLLSFENKVQSQPLRIFFLSVIGFYVNSMIMVAGNKLSCGEKNIKGKVEENCSTME